MRIATLCGLTKTEALYMAPGEVFDLWELFIQARKRKDDPGE